MTSALLAALVGALFAVSIIMLWRQRVFRTGGAERGAASAHQRGRVAETTPPPAAAPPREEKSSGAEVLEHLRRLEERAAPGLAAQVIPIFLQDTSARLSALRDAVARQDTDTAYRLAHALHGSAATVGANSLKHGCAEIIRGLRSGSFDRCEMLIATLDVEFESIRQAVTAQPESRT